MFPFIRFEVLIMVAVQIVVFWLVTPCKVGVLKEKAASVFRGGPENSHFPVHDSCWFVSGPISSPLLGGLIDHCPYNWPV
jgi:hypothetical protein